MRNLCIRTLAAVAVACVTFAAGLQAVQAAEKAPTWTVDTETSRVGFVAQQSGDPVPGEFKSFQAEIAFARGALDKSRVAVTIDIASVDAGAAERNQTITSPDLFHTGKYPQARFVAEGFHKDGGGYIAEGDLTMRGTTHPVELPFTLDISQTDGKLRAVAEGDLTVKRLRWGIGQGQWKSTNMVPNEVRIEIKIVATRPAN